MKKNKDKQIIYSLIMALIPLILCAINLLVSHKGIGDVDITASDWNDELFYYKQVEAIVNNGLPKGYFGFNESRAVNLTFAAWSPVLLLPWVVWGFLFGWNLLSPILCNIILLSISLFAFSYITKMQLNETVLTGISLLAFLPLSRYLLSAMPEINVLCLLILFFALVIKMCEEWSRMAYGFSLLLAFLLVLMRPYFILLFMFPFVEAIRRKRRSAIISVASCILGVILYYIVNKKLAAPYFKDLFFIDWIRAYLSTGFIGGTRFTYNLFMEKWINLLYSFKNLSFTGVYFLLLMLFGAIFFADFIVEIIKKEWGKMWLAIGMFIVHLAMFMAVILMYKLAEGSKHFIVFIVCDLIVLSMMSLAKYYGYAIGTLLMLWVFFIGNTDRQDYLLPENAGIKEEIYAIQNSLNELMPLSDDIGWDNVVMWVYSDSVDGTEKIAKWQYLYAVPSGCGISCCTMDYALSTIPQIKARYVFTVKGGAVENKLLTPNATLLYENTEVALYDFLN